MTAGPEVARPLLVALVESGGMAVWQSGTLWRCPGCGDRTVKTEEFIEGLQRAEGRLRLAATSPDGPLHGCEEALEWLAAFSARIFGCERDRVYLKDDGGDCSFERVSYTSRI
jgi:hypothetical protein